MHAWNWFRAVGVGNDLKSWYGDNPQVEDGREGGNQEFDDDVSGQYEDEVNFMMRRLRLNFYRAEDMMLIYMKRKWAVRMSLCVRRCGVFTVQFCVQEEDREFKIEQDRRKKEKREKMIKRNKERRMKREADQQTLEEEKLQQMLKEEDQLRIVLENLFKCPFCNFLMAPPSPIYQCGDGHILCHQCRHSTKLKVILAGGGGGHGSMLSILSAEIIAGMSEL